MPAAMPKRSRENDVQDKRGLYQYRSSGTLASLRLLAPKPATNISTRAGPVRTSDTCRVCFRRKCTLRSHRMYHGRTISSKGPSTSRPRIDTFDASYASKLVSRYVDKSVATQKVDPFHDLPLPAELHGYIFQMHELFFTCVSSVEHRE